MIVEGAGDPRRLDHVIAIKALARGLSRPYG